MGAAASVRPEPDGPCATDRRSVLRSVAVAVLDRRLRPLRGVLPSRTKSKRPGDVRLASSTRVGSGWVGSGWVGSGSPQGTSTSTGDTSISGARRHCTELKTQATTILTRPVASSTRVGSGSHATRRPVAHSVHRAISSGERLASRRAASTLAGVDSDADRAVSTAAA